MDLNLSNGSETPTDVSNEKSTLLFTQQQTKLVKQLLKGLGIEDHIQAEQITPDVMLQLGQTIKIMLQGSLSTRQLLMNYKSKVTLNKITPQRQMESDALGKDSNINSLAQMLLDPHYSQNGALAKKLEKHYSQVLEDQKILFDGIDDCVSHAVKSFAPETLEKLYNDQQQEQSNAQSSIMQLSNRILSSPQKWVFYKENWKKIRAKLSSDIHKYFENKIVLIHSKRMKDKKSDYS
jgi:glycerol kinase